MPFKNLFPAQQTSDSSAGRRSERARRIAAAAAAAALPSNTDDRAQEGALANLTTIPLTGSCLARVWRKARVRRPDKLQLSANTAALCLFLDSYEIGPKYAR